MDGEHQEGMMMVKNEVRSTARTRMGPQAVVEQMVL